MAYVPKAPGLSWGNSQVAVPGSKVTGVYAATAPGGPATRTRSRLRVALDATKGASGDAITDMAVAGALAAAIAADPTFNPMAGGSRRGSRQHGGGAFTDALGRLAATIRDKVASGGRAIDVAAGAAVTAVTDASAGQVAAALGATLTTSTVLFGSPSFPHISDALLQMIVASPGALSTLLSNTMAGFAGTAALAGAGLAAMVAVSTVAALVVVSIKFGKGSAAVVTASGMAAYRSLSALYNADLTGKVISCLESFGVINDSTGDSTSMVETFLGRIGLRRAAAGGPAIAAVDVGLGVAVVAQPGGEEVATEDVQAMTTVPIPGTTFTVTGPSAAAWIAARSNPGAAAGGMGGGYRKAKKHSRKSHRKSHRKSRRAQRKTKSQRKH